MGKCFRCGRNHRGLCGIPLRTHSSLGGKSLNVGLNIGLNNFRGGLSQIDSIPEIRSENAAKKPISTVTYVLGKLLEDARSCYEKTVEVLKLASTDLPEYDQLLDKETKLSHDIKQLLGQIQAKKRRK